MLLTWSGGEEKSRKGRRALHDEKRGLVSHSTEGEAARFIQGRNSNVVSRA